MRLVSTSELRVGAELEQSLWRLNGEKIAPAGGRLTVEHVQILRGVADGEFALADSLDELAEAGLFERLRDVSELIEGEPSPADVVTSWGRVVLVRGQVVEPHHLRVVEQGAYKRCRVKNNPGRVRQESDHILMTRVQVAEVETALVGRSGRISAGVQNVWEAAGGNRPQPWPNEDELASFREAEVAEVERWFEQLWAGAPVDRQEIEQLVERLYERLVSHRERFTQLAMFCRRRDGHLWDQGYSVAVLAMATAAELGWSPDSVRRAGTCGLLADVGMMYIPRHVRQGEAKLKQADREAVERHPAYSLAMLGQIEGLDPAVRWAVYQHHEREGGIGYPKMRRGDQICDLARVLAVADVFAAATAPRHYREAKLPYHVMEQIIRAAASNVFHKGATRALVQAAGLFPVGSYVQLSDGRRAYVVATHADQLDRPVVRMIDDCGEATDEVTDLAVVPSDKLAVARPVAPPESASSQPPAAEPTPQLAGE